MASEKTTGIALRVRAIAACKSNPFICGICRSMIMQPGDSESNCSKTSAELNGCTAKPLARSSRVAAERNEASSSTMNTVGSRDAPFSDRQGQAKSCSALGVVFSPNLSSVRLDDRPRDRQTEAHALQLGGEERLEQCLAFIRYTMPIVTDGHLDKTVAGSPSTHRQQALAVSYAGLSVHAVEQEIEQYLLKVNSVTAGEWQIPGHVDLDANVPCCTVRARERHDFIHQLAQHHGAGSRCRRLSSARNRSITSPARCSLRISATIARNSSRSG